MAPDIDAATELLKDEKVWFAVQPHTERYFMEQGVETRSSSPTTSAMRHGHVPKRRRSSSVINNGYFDGHIINVLESDDDVPPAKIPAKLPRALCMVDE